MIRVQITSESERRTLRAHSIPTKISCHADQAGVCTSIMTAGMFPLSTRLDLFGNIVANI